MLVTATLIVLALATLGDATQIGLFLFMSLYQGKYNMCCCHQHYRRRYCVNFRQWKYDLMPAALTRDYLPWLPWAAQQKR
jgi:hypothetical protein